MKGKLLNFVFASLFVLPFFITANATAAEVLMEKETIVIYDKEVDLIRIVDNFIVLYDTSSSMGEPYDKDKSMKKIDAAEEILKEDIENLPELKWNSGLYRYTPGGIMPKTGFEPYYEMKLFNKAEFLNAVDKLPNKAAGPTLLHNALYKLDGLLSGLSGKTAIFLFTDGQYTPMGIQRKPLELAQELAEKYDVCFYIISTAKGAAAKRLLKNVAEINQCSRIIDFNELRGKPEYFTGVLYVVEEKMIEASETLDKVAGIKLDNVLFDFDKMSIKPEFYDELDALGKFLSENSQAYVVLSGFTDSIGSAEYNLGLSRKRAESVDSYLAEKFNIAKDRIVLQWYGEADPVASNSTDFGRSQNRRVECVVSGMK
jgi:OOP family OmpA-OmpF porin